MPKYPKYTALEDGWSEEIFPNMKGYKLACCDCGLVHVLDFQVVEVVRTQKVSKHITEHHTKPKRTKKLRVTFKARRDNRATGQIRRWMKRENAD